VLGAFWRFAAQFGGEILDYLVEVRMSLSAVEQLDQMLAQRLVVWHG